MTAPITTDPNTIVLATADATHPFRRLTPYNMALVIATLDTIVNHRSPQHSNSHHSTFTQQFHHDDPQSHTNLVTQSQSYTDLVFQSNSFPLYFKLNNLRQE